MPERKPNGLSCEVCGKPLSGKQRRACSSECRTKLGTAAAADRAQLAREVARNQVTEVVRTALEAEVGPVVREALTAEVMKSIKSMVDLMPAAIAALGDNLSAEDPELAQKAATTLLRYTMGNPSVAPPPITEEKSPLQINFTIPRADGSGPRDAHWQAQTAPDTTAEDLDVIGDALEEGELRECMECHIVKPTDQFVGQSPRCQSCHDQLVARVTADYGKIDLG